MITMRTTSAPKPNASLVETFISEFVPACITHSSFAGCLKWTENRYSCCLYLQKLSGPVP